jgi:hypothetical protein
LTVSVIKPEIEMPLHRSDDAYEWDGDNVWFPMTNGQDRIMWRVSRMALDDISSRKRIPDDPIANFLEYRIAIEKEAGALYEAGDEERLIKSEDLSHLP